MVPQEKLYFTFNLFGRQSAKDSTWQSFIHLEELRNQEYVYSREYIAYVNSGADWSMIWSSAIFNTDN